MRPARKNWRSGRRKRLPPAMSWNRSVWMLPRWSRKHSSRGSNIARVQKEAQALEEELALVEQHLREDAGDVQEKERISEDP